MPNNNKKIKINVVTGTKDKTQLDGCYFQQDEAPATTYTFYDQNGGATLATGIPSGTAYTCSNFTFPNGTYSWSVTVTIDATALTASGSWTNTDTTADDVEPESGTFTAQADPIEEEAASSANA